MAYAKSAMQQVAFFLHWQTDSLSYRKSIQSASEYRFFMLIHVVNIEQTRPNTVYRQYYLPMPVLFFEKNQQSNNNAGRKCMIVEKNQIAVMESVEEKC